MLNLPVSFSAFFLIRQMRCQGLSYLIYVTLFPDRFQHGVFFLNRYPARHLLKESFFVLFKGNANT
jgi:hypothetical protein